MPDTEYIKTVETSIRLMSEALEEITYTLDQAWQRGECWNPIWQEVATQAKHLATNAETLRLKIQQVIPGGA